MHARNFLNTSRHSTSKRFRVSSFSFATLLAGHDGGVAREAFLSDDVVERRPAGVERAPHQRDRFGEVVEQFLVRSCRVALPAADAVRERAGERGQRPAQALEDAAVVDDQAVVLALVDPVGAGDALHQRVGLERLVEVEGGEARHVEAGQPHGAHDGDAERVLLFLERVVDGHLLHVSEPRLGAHRRGQLHALLDEPAVGDDVEVPAAELLDLALLLAHDDGGASLAHPGDLPAQVDRLLLAGGLRVLRLQFPDALAPVALDQPVHPHAGDLVDTDQHRLAGLPRRRIMAHEVACHLVEPLVCGDNVVVAPQLPLETLRDVDVVDLQLVQLVGDAFVQVADGHAEPLAAGAVVEGHGGPVLHRALEVVGRDVFAEHLAGDLVAGEQRPYR